MTSIISIVMPAYNAGKFLDQAINSIIEQTYQDWELLVADDASTDNTKAILNVYCQKDRRIKAYHNPENLGYLKSCNKLLAIANGDYITFQDADDWSSPSRLSDQISAFKEDPSLGLCGTNGVIVDEKGEKIRFSNRPQSSHEISKEIQVQNPFIGASIMIKREVKNNFPAYQEYFEGKGWEDYDWAYRISEEYKCINIPGFLYFYRQHASSISKDIPLIKHISNKIVIFLSQQRAKNNGLDALTDTQLFPELISFITKTKQPYIADYSLLHIEKAAAYMYIQLYASAIASSWKAIVKTPFKLNPYRTLLYCLRKAFINNLKTFFRLP